MTDYQATKKRFLKQLLCAAVFDYAMARQRRIDRFGEYAELSVEVNLARRAVFHLAECLTLRIWPETLANLFGSNYSWTCDTWRL